MGKKFCAPPLFVAELRHCRVGINQRIRILHIGYEFSLLRIRPCFEISSNRTEKESGKVIYIVKISHNLSKAESGPNRRAKRPMPKRPRAEKAGTSGDRSDIGPKRLATKMCTCQEMKNVCQHKYAISLFI